MSPTVLVPSTAAAKTAGIVHLIGQLARGGAEQQLAYVADALKRREWRQVVVSFSLGGVWKDRLLDMDLPVYEIPPHRVKLWRLWQLYGVVRHERPQIAVSWSPHAGVYAQWLPRPHRLRRVFCVLANFSLDSNTGKPIRDLNRYRHALAKADFVVSNSSDGLNILLDHGFRLPRTAVIRNITFARGSAVPGNPVEVPRIVAVGSLKPLKAYDVLLAALARVAAQGTRFELRVAGVGPEHARLVALAAQLRLSDSVQFLGNVPDLSSLWSAAHLVVHPSRSEGLSCTITDAMAEGLPIVATAVGGTPEIIEDGRTGLLVPPGEAQPLADAIRRLLLDPVLRGRLGQASLQFIRKICDEDKIADEYEAVFKYVLEAR
jgi:glycosyltransferase involved in cell wall biosynthesis